MPNTAGVQSLARGRRGPGLVPRARAPCACALRVRLARAPCAPGGLPGAARAHVSSPGRSRAPTFLVMIKKKSRTAVYTGTVCIFCVF